MAEKKKAKPISSTARAKLIFPVGRLTTFLRKSAPKNVRVSPKAGIYLAAALEFLCLELLEGSSDQRAARSLPSEKSARPQIATRDLYFAIRNDSAMALLFSGTIKKSGVMPSIHSALISQEKGYKKWTKNKNLAVGGTQTEVPEEEKEKKTPKKSKKASVKSKKASVKSKKASKKGKNKKASKKGKNKKASIKGGKNKNSKKGKGKNSQKNEKALESGKGKNSSEPKPKSVPSSETKRDAKVKKEGSSSNQKSK